MTMPLVACSRCRRHSREGAPCHFCGATLTSVPARRIALPLRLAAIAALTIGCDDGYEIPPYGAPPIDAAVDVAPDADAKD